MQQIVLESDKGKTLRYFSWQGNEAKLIHRNDTKRIELLDKSRWSDLEDLEFLEISEIDRESLKKGLNFEGVGRLRLVDNVNEPMIDSDSQEESNRDLWASLLFVLVIASLVIGSFFIKPPSEDFAEENLKEELERVIKLTPKMRIATPTQAKPVTKTRSLKRMGALAALGSLNKSQQKGGLDLGALNASKGIGQGGSEGSGGVQRSIYSKGLVAAPLGSGANLKGAGGVGTKGKGGGKAGYGQLSMVGSVGDASIALSDTTVSGGGLDMDAINAVIQKNIGQIRFCYEQGLQSDSSLSGRVAVDFVIGGAGRVISAGVGSTSLQSSMVESCILMRLRSWNFPKPEGGVDVKVSYPFVLKRVGTS